MKTLLITLLLFGSMSYGAKCVVNDKDVGTIEVTGENLDHALERAIVKCFNLKQSNYQSNNKKLDFNVLKSFIDDCANPVCENNN